jgi:hypothetical protein
MTFFFSSVEIDLCCCVMNIGKLSRDAIIRAVTKYPIIGSIGVTLSVRKNDVYDAKDDVGDVNIAVATPVTINVNTATNDRGDSRPNPQTP